ncbi:hypothetical protein [Sphingomonas sp. CARO-RG-8B-R24-01]|uniref:hypothetical protein n=1 Tax=Sphingomonas sp. CARO-RG-8B-R24-01 TaxID=2914831 RepID=UPI001F5626C4|nr:hypothetical protein [Sphingomonas sp. CARO-RG-8B-R24-01]
MVTETRRAPRVVREQTNMSAACAVIDARLNAERKAARVARWQRILAAVEPWYNWGEIYIERMQGMRMGSDDFPQAIGEGCVRYVEIQWFGIHFAVQFGRTPKVASEVRS